MYTVLDDIVCNLWVNNGSIRVSNNAFSIDEAMDLCQEHYENLVCANMSDETKEDLT